MDSTNLLPLLLSLFDTIWFISLVLNAFLVLNVELSGLAISLITSINSSMDDFIVRLWLFLNDSSADKTDFLYTAWLMPYLGLFTKDAKTLATPIVEFELLRFLVTAPVVSTILPNPSSFFDADSFINVTKSLAVLSPVLAQTNPLSLKSNG